MRYEVRDHFGGRGKTHRKKFTSKPAALFYAQQRATMMCNGQSAKWRLNDTQAYEAERALEILKPTGRTILEAAADYVERWKLTSQQRLAASPTVSKILEDYLTNKSRQQLSEYHLRDIKSRLGRFAKDFNVPINRILRSELEDWLNGLKVGACTWNNYRQALAGLFQFAKERKELPADWAELDSLKPCRIKGRTIRLFTPEQMRLLLNECKTSFLPVIVLGAFAGLRSEEIARIKWSDFKWEKGHIYLGSEVTKTNRTRTVPILPNLAEWLKPWTELNKRVFEHTTASAQKCALAKQLGFKWGRNTLRHSFISYRLALIKDIAQVAVEAGNSPSVIHKHYLELTSPAEAQEWFEIRPTTVTQIILPHIFG
jgi:integrase